MRTHTWMCRRVPPARLPRFGLTEVIITAPCTAESEARMESTFTTLGSDPALVRHGVGIILRERKRPASGPGPGRYCFGTALTLMTTSVQTFGLHEPAAHSPEGARG